MKILWWASSRRRGGNIVFISLQSHMILRIQMLLKILISKRSLLIALTNKLKESLNFWKISTNCSLGGSRARTSVIPIPGVLSLYWLDFFLFSRLLSSSLAAADFCSRETKYSMSSKEWFSMSYAEDWNGFQFEPIKDQHRHEPNTFILSQKSATSNKQLYAQMMT